MSANGPFHVGGERRKWWQIAVTFEPRARMREVRRAKAALADVVVGAFGVDGLDAEIGEKWPTAETWTFIARALRRLPVREVRIAPIDDVAGALECEPWAVALDEVEP